MMTIKAFAKLCGCTAQTLRYYDRVGVLRPAQVDKWSGYRYYEERQALDYVKIKNLQAADFSIGEVCALLTQPDEAVYEAFERQIAAQQEKLERIRKIQQTYLREKSNMEKLLHGVIDYLLEGCQTPAVLREFGYEEADYDRVMAEVRTWLNGKFAPMPVPPEQVMLEVNGEKTVGMAQVTEKLAALPRDDYQDVVHLTASDEPADNAPFEVVWERHGWVHPQEFLQEIPALTGEKEYLFSVRLAEFPYPRDLSYGLLLVGVMMLERGQFPCRGCEVEHSEDGQNHFALMRKKETA